MNVSLSFLIGVAPGVDLCYCNHSLTCLIYGEFRDALLKTLAVTNVYLSYCCLSISSNQSVHSPLTSGINKASISSWILKSSIMPTPPQKKKKRKEETVKAKLLSPNNSLEKPSCPKKYKEKEVKRSARRDKRTFAESLAKEAEKAAAF